MIKEDIILTNINKTEALRYLGITVGHADEKILNLINICERELLSIIKPRIVYREFDITRTEKGLQLKNTTLTLEGKDITKHLDGCNKVILMCATLSESVDKLIRVLQIKEMDKALIIDSLASVAIDEVCDKVCVHIKETYINYYLTWRYGIGYGDLSLDIAKPFLEILNANREIGLYVNESNILLPKKSIACIIGLSESQIKQSKRSCLNCNMKDTCVYRKKGERCGI